MFYFGVGGAEKSSRQCKSEVIFWEFYFKIANNVTEIH